MKTDLDLTKKIVAGEEFSLTINYNRTLEEMIDAGHYDKKDNNIITKNFPILLPAGLNNNTDCVKSKLLTPNSYVGNPTQDELVRINKEGYRPSTLFELLAFGEIYPEIQRQIDIISLGSIWERHRKLFEESYFNGSFVPYLSVNILKRILSTRHLYTDRWDCQKFLVILRE